MNNSQKISTFAGVALLIIGIFFQGRGLLFSVVTFAINDYNPVLRGNLRDFLVATPLLAAASILSKRKIRWTSVTVMILGSFTVLDFFARYNWN